MKMNSKKTPKCLFLAVVMLALLGLLLASCAAPEDAGPIPTEEAYSFENPKGISAEPDEGFVIDGILDEKAYQNCNWLKLENTQGGAGVDLVMTSFYGEKGMYIVYDITESARIYVNPERPTYLNSCVEMYLASANASSMNSNEIFEIDMLPTGQLSIRQRTGKDNWVNVASTDDVMARLGATTKGGPVNTPECYGYNLELFIPWEYLDYVGLDTSEMKREHIFINPVHITSYNYEGTESGTDRYWYAFATQAGGDGWNDVTQFFRFGENGVIGTAPIELVAGDNYTVSGNDSVIPGMMTTIRLKPDAGYTFSSIKVNGEEYIQKAAYNADGSVTLELRGEREGLKIEAAVEQVSAGSKTLSGTVQLNKLGGDTLDGVSISYKGPTGEKPIELDAEGKFSLPDLTQGYYTVMVTKTGYAPINRGIYLDRDVDVQLALEYQLFKAESGYNWILDDQNDGVLKHFGGSGKILSVDSYNKFGVKASFKYDAELAEQSSGDTFYQQRSGIQIKFSNGKYWRVDLMKENGVFKVQYAKHNESTLFDWKTVHVLTQQEIGQYQSEEGIELSILRDKNYAWVCLNGRPVAIEVLDAAYAEYTAQIGFEGWIANPQIEEMKYDIFESFSQNLKSFYFTTNTQWDISGQLEGKLTLPNGGVATIPFYSKYTDFDITLKDIKEHDTTGKKPGRTDILLEFDTNGDGKTDKSVSFGVVCTDSAKKTCWVQTLGNADNYIGATRIKGLYKLSTAEAKKYLSGGGVDLRVVRKGTEVYVFLEGNAVAIWDLTQNGSRVTAKTPAKVSVRHYDAQSTVELGFAISSKAGNIQISKIFKDNDNWNLSKQNQGTVTVDNVKKTKGQVSLPGGGTDTSLQLFKKYQNIDFTVTAKEYDTTGKKAGRTDIMFEFDINNDGTMDKNVSFGIVQVSGGRCVVQTLGWPDKHIPAKRINELYELDYAETLKYKGEGIDLRVVRYGTNAYIYVGGKQVAVFDLTQNNSGVKAATKASVFLRHYDAVADAVVIPFTVTDQVTQPEVVPLPESVFKPNNKWDLTQQNQGTVTVNGVEALKGVASLPGGGTSAVVFRDQFTDIDLTITAKENKAPTAANGGRTDILFEFDTNGDGTVDKSVSFGITKWSATSSCIIETLGNSTNHIPASRKNTLYTLNAEETEAYLADGVELRVVRSGTDVYVFFEGKAVAVFDLTQNNSGVTADMKATVSLRHYDAVADRVDIPFTVADEITRVTITDNSVNGKVVADRDTYVVGAQIVLRAEAEGYGLQSLKVDGEPVEVGAGGTYRFVATKSSYTVEGTFTRNIFVSNEKWDLTKQNQGTVTADGIEKIKGEVSLPGGGTEKVVFSDKFTDMDLTVIAKENKAPTAANGGRTDILFEFDTNGDGTVDKSVSVGIVKWSATSSCIVETLGNSNNYLTPTRKVNLYTLNAEETEDYLADGVEIRLIRKGTDVHVLVEGKEVNVLDLSQNNSGVTADMKAIVSLRHYDAVAEKVVIPFLVADALPNVSIVDSSANGQVLTDATDYAIGAEVTLSATAKEGYYLAGMKVNGEEVTLSAGGTYTFTAEKFRYTVEGIFRAKLFQDNAKWDLTQQNQGTVTANGVPAIKGEVTLPGGGTEKVVFLDRYTDIDLTITAKENKTSATANGGRTDVLFEFDTNGDGTVDKSVSFGIVKWSATSSCIVETLGNSNNYLTAVRKNTLYTLSATETAKYLDSGVQIRLLRKGTGVLVYVEGNLVSTFDLTQNNSGVTADMKATVSLRHYDAVAEKVVIPFTVSTQTEVPTVYGTGYVPVSGQQVKTTSSFASMPRTIEVTFNRSSKSSRMILLGNCGGSSNDYFNLECPINEDIIYLNLCLGGTTYQHSFHTVSVPTGKDVRVTVVLEDAAVKCYINGVLAQTRTATNGGNGSKSMSALWASAPNANLSNLWGIGNDLRNYPFAGTIYDIALWSDARTAEEIAGSSIASLGTAGYQDNLLAAYNFRASYKATEAQAKFAKDLSGNGNHLTGTLNVGTSTTAPVLTFAAIPAESDEDEQH